MKKVRKLKLFLCIALFFSMCMNVSAEDETTSPVPRADITLAVDDQDFITIMPDENFRKAVVQNIQDEGMDSGPSVQQILESYTGSINAEKKGIVNIQGIEYLKMAETINLKKNKITDFTPAAKANDHYGSVDHDVTWRLGGNPFELIPADFGGRLVIEAAATTSYTYPFNPTTDIHSFIRTQASQRFNLTLDVGKSVLLGNSEGNDFVTNGYAKIVTLNLIKKTIDPDTPSNLYPLDLPVEVLDASQALGNVKNKFVKVSNVLLNEDLMLGVGIDQILKYLTTDENGTVTSGSQSFKYYVSPKVVVYDKVKLVHSDLGSASLTKTAKDTGKPLMNAEYSVYQGETIIKSGLKTDEDGQVVVRELVGGNYYFKETKAPEGYKIDETPIPFTIKDPENAHGTITGGEGQTVTSTDGNAATAGNDELFIAGNEYNDLDLMVSGAGEFSIIVDYSALARSDGERGPHGEVDERPYTRIFSSADEAEKDINDMKNANRVAGPITISVQYAPNTSVSQINEPIPETPTPDTPEEPSPETPEVSTPETTTPKAPNENKNSPATGVENRQTNTWFIIGGIAMLLAGCITYKKNKLNNDKA